MISVIKETNHANWDQELGMTGGSIFLSREWLISVQDTRKKPLYLSFQRDGKKLGMIAGLERPVKGTDYSQLFFYSGMVLDNPSSELLSECKSALLEYAKNNGFARIIIKSYDYNRAVLSFHKGFKTFQRGEYYIDLNKPIHEIESGFSKNARRLLKKTRADGLIFQKGQSGELLEKLFSLLNSTHEIRYSKGYGNYEIFSIPFLTKPVLLKLLQSGMGTLFYIESGGEIISMQFTIMSGKRGYGMLMGTTEQGYAANAPTLLWYEVILFLKEKGMKSFNLGGLPLGKKNAGLDRFKRSLGAVPLMSPEEFTDFLIRPLSGLNLFLAAKRKILKYKLPWKLKKMIVDIPDVFIKGRDEY